MHIISVGLNHETTPLELREKLAFQPKRIGQALAQLTHQTNGRRSDSEIAEAVILSTCNRVELYVMAKDSKAAIERIKHFLSEYHKVPVSAFESHLYHFTDLEAVEHLFCVSSGINSMVVGETQIQGQVKESFEWALQYQTAGPFLSALFQNALTVGKRARKETSISERTLSVSGAAVNLVLKSFPDVRNLKVVVIGLGEMGLLAIKNLCSLGVQHVTIVNRTQERIGAIADRFKVKARGFDSLNECLAQADVVISSTGAPHVVLSSERMRQILARRAERQLLIVDIAVPRDVEPTVAKLENVRLHNIDQLEAEVERNRERRCDEVNRVRDIINQEIKNFLAWHQSLEVKPVITGLRQKVEQIRKQELERALRRFDQSLSESDEQVINELSRRIVNKILHQPVVRLKEQAAEGNGELYSAAVRNLFSLEDDQE
ncbi:MAG: glutamyl-tRNA reductase [Aliifodinibius sp.]|nr:glutamyl-tRNA reductase [Fodinibius sp.]NIV14845.1 glutamyl-tRNA reductase [Fodinibius sp.]NIY28724.1 glutamyl-tRNA reductase [Fodinibius sp.]